MTKNLRRYYGSGTLHFVTCSCYRRLPLLGSARARDAFVRILHQTRLRYPFALVGYVVMRTLPPADRRAPDWNARDRPASPQAARLPDLAVPPAQAKPGSPAPPVAGRVC